MANIAQDLLSLVVPMSDFSPDPSNAREGHNVEAIAASLRKYGQRKPIVVNVETGTIEAGNGTFLAAKLLGWSEIAVVKVKDDPITHTGYAIADNRLSDLSMFDFDILSSLLDSMPDALEIPGIDEDFLKEIGAALENVEFKEYDESVADEVEFIECPECHHRWPK